MSDEDAFLRAICDQPDEDTPRLAFADWLTERGGAVNVAWAAGIRAQVWMARGATDEALAFQACVFDSNYGRERLRERLELPEEVSGDWERGFPATAAGPFSQLRDVWPGVAFRIPIRKFHAYDLTAADVAEFVTWPALTALRELECTGCSWDDPQADLLSVLARCASLRHLKTLRLYNALTDDDTVSALLASPHLAGLDVFQMGYQRNLRELSDAVRDRLTARFGQNVFVDDSIPF